MKKNIVLVLCAVLFLCPCFSEEKDEPLISDETVEALKDGGTRLLHDMQGALQKVNDSLDKKIKSVTSRACVGTWKFENGKCTTTIKCLETGEMEVSQTGAVGGRILWRGNYVSSLSQIEFTVNTKISATMFTKKNESLNEEWIISYELLSDGKIKITSDDLPDDANGYSFKNATLFSEVR